jgi:hypothetical protein
MEYIDGEDLATVIRLGRPTPEKALEIARELCRGLAAAHEAGMLHRDLKPGNVMIDGRGRARITDFGLAGLAADLMREGQVAGTPAYMAPEQLAQGKVSVRSDVYSLGLVLYELFTGRRAFEATSLSELRQLQESGSITTPSDLARGIDPAVERVIMHCLEHDPDSRPTSAYAVLAALPVWRARRRRSPRARRHRASWWPTRAAWHRQPAEGGALVLARTAQPRAMERHDRPQLRPPDAIHSGALGARERLADAHRSRATAASAHGRRLRAQQRGADGRIEASCRTFAGAQSGLLLAAVERANDHAPQHSRRPPHAG